MEKNVKQVEDLFENAPLTFNDETVNQELDKIERVKFEKKTYKTFVQIHDEEMAA